MDVVHDSLCFSGFFTGNRNSPLLNYNCVHWMYVLYGSLIMFSLTLLHDLTYSVWYFDKTLRLFPFKINPSQPTLSRLLYYHGHESTCDLIFTPPYHQYYRRDKSTVGFDTTLFLDFGVVEVSRGISCLRLCLGRHPNCVHEVTDWWLQVSWTTVKFV